MSTSYSLTPSTVSAVEGTQITFTVTRSGDKPAETIYLSTLSDGTATYGEGDYTTTSGGSPANIPMTFSSGTTSRTVTLNIVNDGVSDSGEQFRAIVQRNSSDPVSTYLDRSAYVTISDPGQNTSYSLAPSSTSVTEGDQVTFTITRSGDKPAETVYFSTLADGTATYSEGDYSTSSGGNPSNIAVSFSSGATSRTVTLNVLNDGVSDAGEQFRAIVQRSSSDPVSTYLDRSSYVTINDAAAAGTTYSLSASPGTINEGGTVSFTITRSGDKPAETVYFSTLSDGTATFAEGDYTTTSGGAPSNVAVAFSSGDTSEVVTINIVSDGVSDSGEQFRAIVQRSTSDPATNYLSRSGFVTINDVAAGGSSYVLSASPSTANEGSTVTFTITRSGDKPAETVYFSTLSDGTATFAEGDYTTTSGGAPANVAVSFASGETSRNVSLNVLSDGVSDSGEQFRAIVQRNTSDSVSTYLSRSGYVTIQDAGTSSPADDYRDEPEDTSTSLGSVAVGGTISGVIGPADANDSYGDKDLFAVTLNAGQTYQLRLQSTSVGGSALPSGIFTVRDPANFNDPRLTSDSGSNVTETFTADRTGTYYVRVGSGGSSTDTGRYSLSLSATAQQQGTTWSITPASASVSEGTQMSFTIARSGDKPATTVYFSTLSDGTATFAEGDYRLSDGRTPKNIAVSFATGETSKAVTLDILQDNTSDSGERFRTIVQGNASDGVGLFLDRSAYVTVNDANLVEQTGQGGGGIGPLGYFATVAHAATLAPLDHLFLPFAAGTSSSITQGAGGATSHRQGTARTALDFELSFGREVRPIADGTVVYSETHHPNYHSEVTVDDMLRPLDPTYDLGTGKLGNFVTIEHRVLLDGQVRTFYATYAHLSPSGIVGTGQDVFLGSKLGSVGRTGAILGTHLHVQVGWILDNRQLPNGSVAKIADGSAVSSKGESGDDLIRKLFFTDGNFFWPFDTNKPQQPVLSKNDASASGSTDVRTGVAGESGQDIFVLAKDAAQSVVNILASGADVIVGGLGYGSRFLLNAFESVKLVGSEVSDYFRTGSLLDTSILNDTIYFDGGAGDDIVDASATERRVVAEGGIGADTIRGGAGFDLLNGGEGDDKLDGAGGIDTAIFTGTRADNWVVNFGSGQFGTSGPDGLDNLKGIERVQFSDGTYALPTSFFGQSGQVSNSFGAGPGAGGWADERTYPRTLADVNGDGRADIVGFGHAGVYVSIANAGGGFGGAYLAAGAFGAAAEAGGWSNDDIYTRSLADVNGDDRADIVGFGHSGVYVALADGSGGFGNSYLASNAFGAGVEAGGWSDANTYPRLLADVNGDGRADIAGFGHAGVYVALGNSGGGFDAMYFADGAFGAGPGAGGWSNNAVYPRALADVDADGRADLVGFGHAGVYVALADGSGGFADAILAKGAFGAGAEAGGWSDDNIYPRMLGDMNGDGRADIVGFGHGGTWVAIATGAATFRDPVLATNAFGAGAQAGGWTDANTFPRLLADVNGDRMADLVGFGFNGVHVALAADLVQIA